MNQARWLGMTALCCLLAAPLGHAAQATAVPTHLKYANRAALAAPVLRSSAALVLDTTHSSVLYSRAPDVAMPIASITKLMTALVVMDAGQPLDETLTVTDEDRSLGKGAASRLAPGTHLTRGDLMHLALMASENRAAHALGRNYPGGLAACVAAMNAKARELGMTQRALRRAHRALGRERRQPRGPLEAGDGGRQGARHPRVLHRQRLRRAGRAAHGAVPQYRLAGEQGRTGTSWCRRPATSPRPAAAW